MPSIQWHLDTGGQLRRLLHNDQSIERKRALDEFPPASDPATLDVVAGCFGDDTPAVCEAAVDALARMTSVAAASAAVRHLDAAQPAERGYAADALARCGHHATPIVIGLLKEEAPSKRKYAVEILARIGGPIAVNALIEALDDMDTDVAAGAAEALGTLKETGSVPHLVAALNHPSDWVRYAVVRSLGSLGGSDALSALCRLPHGSDMVNVAVVHALGQVGAQESRHALVCLAGLLAGNPAPPLEAAVDAVNSILRACSALPEIDLQVAEAICGVLRKGLASEQPNIRSAALRCLALAGDTQPACTLLVTDAVPDVRLAALRVLAMVESLDERAVDACRSTASPEIEPLLRAAALRVLLAHGKHGALDLCVAFLSDMCQRVDDDALAELATCTPACLVPLVQHVFAVKSGAVRRLAFTRLLATSHAAELGRVAAGCDLMRRAFGEHDWHIRAHAVRLLGAAGAGWARPVLQRAGSDTDPRVRARAIQALASFGLEAADVTQVTLSLADPDGWVRTAAVQALGSANCLDDDQMLAALRDDFSPVVLAGLSAVRHHHGDPSSIGSAQLRAELAPLAHRDFVQDDPDLSQWCSGAASLHQ